MTYSVYPNFGELINQSSLFKKKNVVIIILLTSLISMMMIDLHKDRHHYINVVNLLTYLINFTLQYYEVTLNVFFCFSITVLVKSPVFTNCVLSQCIFNRYCNNLKSQRDTRLQFPTTITTVYYYLYCPLWKWRMYEKSLYKTDELALRLWLQLQAS